MKKVREALLALTGEANAFSVVHEVTSHVCLSRYTCLPRHVDLAIILFVSICVIPVVCVCLCACDLVSGVL